MTQTETMNAKGLRKAADTNLVVSISCKQILMITRKHLKLLESLVQKAAGTISVMYDV